VALNFSFFTVIYSLIMIRRKRFLCFQLASVLRQPLSLKFLLLYFSTALLQFLFAFAALLEQNCFHFMHSAAVFLL